MSSAEWMAEYRQRMREDEPKKYLEYLAREALRQARKRREKHQRILAELKEKPEALAAYLRLRKRASAGGRKTASRRSNVRTR